MKGENTQHKTCYIQNITQVQSRGIFVHTCVAYYSKNIKNTPFNVSTNKNLIGTCRSRIGN